MRIREAKYLARLISIITGSLVVTGIGYLCLFHSVGEPVRRRSYDLPFTWRGVIDTREIALVYLDDYSAKQLGQRVDDVWNRALHVQLLDRLTQDGARLVFYDIVFDQPADPGADAALERAIQANGKVILGAALDIVERVGSAKQERVLAPLRSLRKAAAGWGLLAFRPVDADYGVRQMYLGTSTAPAATWKAAEVLGAPATREPRDTPVPRWINYYGPRDTFSSVNLIDALTPGSVPPDYFKDKIVLIGGRPTLGYLAERRDEFVTPFYRRDHHFSPGLEVHASILLNLLRADWLTALQERWQLVIVVCVGILAGGVLTLLRPFWAVMVAIVAAALITFTASWVQWNQRVWFSWLIPAAIQVPAGLVWSISSQYLLESRRRKELRRAFGFYLSPQMADQIANSDFDLRPGGKLVDVTVIFTDLENFTTISEHLDPSEVSEILTSYFGQTTKCILENKGTIIKYIGDAVFAAWGAPIDEPAHAMRAAAAACDLRGLTELDIQGKRLRTRIGIHSGRVLAGNLGSSFRFDYTMIGDAVNFASRLESLNKYLSTQVLMSGAVRDQLGSNFIVRPLGEFKVAGKTQSVAIHELICRAGAGSDKPEWVNIFEEGVAAFVKADFDRARDAMEKTRALRGGSDGPAEFYLERLAEYSSEQIPTTWTGVVSLDKK